MTGRHCPYLNFSQPEYAIPENQQIANLQVGTANLCIIRSWKRDF